MNFNFLPIKNFVFDIAIIGSGPAGSSCALALQGSGLKVALIDKDQFPRDKVCGDAIPGHAFKAMDRINPAWGIRMRAFADKSDIQSARAYIPNGKSIIYHWVNYSYNSKRIHFDNFLFNLVRSETDTTIFENTRLQTITKTDNSVTCSFIDGSLMEAGLVIGCDGSNSVVTRQLGSFDLRGEHVAIAVRAYYKGISGLEKGVNEFHFFKEALPGYFWIFPLEDGWANVGFGLSSNKKSNGENGTPLRQTFQTLIAETPVLKERFSNAYSPEPCKGFSLPLGLERKKISGERFMLCGDAASLVDPIGGHGIDNAMWSGLFAAEQAIACFQSNNFSADKMEAYDEAVYKKMGAKLFRGAYLLKLMDRFPFLFHFFTWVATSQKFTKKILRLFKV